MLLFYSRIKQLKRCCACLIYIAFLQTQKTLQFAEGGFLIFFH
ncbi:hypothetical protein BMETH_344_0 [methanotrophic bacterial endosymbiont of Bathymodiolus sp.]|nr:hypothetical protein BMETH_344_0 [methanotrophic bacterial endosymbiont of Bathymodiolus sp.]